jgi:ADP-ribose pyrophosphatase YjhB (NUDIX family)
MLDHHIQRSIVYNLALADSLRFSQLKPDYIENKLFTYHLKKVISAGYVHKNEEGVYELTAAGKRLGLRVMGGTDVDVNKPHSVLFLVVRRKKDNAWLLYKRGAHPLKDKIGFMHAVPEPEISIIDTARRILKEKTGLEGEFKALGGGYFRMFKNDSLESFTHFTLLSCDDAKGELIQTHEHAEYDWFIDPDFLDEAMLPNMATLVEKYNANKPFFIEETFQLT